MNFSLNPIIEVLTTGISVSDIIIILSSFAALFIVFILLWLGIRKLIKIFYYAVFYGVTPFTSEKKYRNSMKKKYSNTSVHYL